jgi:hypothetical protein
VANAAFLFGLFHRTLPVQLPSWAAPVFLTALGVSAIQVAMRVAASGRIYGARFAALVPLRLLWGNLVNCAATILALRQFASARLHRRRLDWRKTEHLYPIHHESGRPRLGDVLVSIRVATREAVEEAAARKPESLRLGEHLIFLQQISEQDLYRALSVQTGIPIGIPRRTDLRERTTRVLPAEMARRWKVLPYRVALGQLHLLTAEPPSEEMTRELTAHCRLELRFRLVRPAEFQRLAASYLPAGSD